MAWPLSLSSGVSCPLHGLYSPKAEAARPSSGPDTDAQTVLFGGHRQGPEWEGPTAGAVSRWGHL